MAVRVILEVARKRSFASALDWPGWSRSGRTTDEALAALLRAGPRYAAVARRAGLAFDPPESVDEPEVVEEVPGGGGTEFGVPGVPAAAEDEPVDRAELDRLISLLRAAWDELGAVASGARGRELRKGPRGGGRDLEKILDHVFEAEVAYLGQLGARPPQGNDPTRVRAAFLDTLEARVTGRAIANPRRTKSPWSPRYAVRRTIWHALDHAWEIEDRVVPGEPSRS